MQLQLLLDLSTAHWTDLSQEGFNIFRLLQVPLRPDDVTGVLWAIDITI